MSFRSDSTRRAPSVLFTVILCTALLAPRAVAAPLKAEDVPTFQLRFRVVSLKKQKPAEQTFRLRGLKKLSAQSTGREWSEWVPFDNEQAAHALTLYPNLRLKGFPVVIKLTLSAVEDPTKLELELKLDGEETVTPLSVELSGPGVGLMLWRDADNRVQAGTMADFNRRTIWEKIEAPSAAAARRPQQFPIVDRFIGGSNDAIEWREGIDHLARYGFTAIMLPANQGIRSILEQTGLRRSSSAIYNPPGYAFEFTLKDKEKGDGTLTTEQLVDQWAQNLAKPYADAGYDLRDVAIYAMSDEPGWYYPATLEKLQQHPESMARFHRFLQDQGLQPADLGATRWDQVQPVGVSRATDLPGRKLFYWTMRFMTWDSARHFATATRAFDKAFYPGIPNPVNWNFFSGRSYVPGPVANNGQKTSPDAAMGGHDWFEFARMRGTNMLWTEDWFSDAMAPQWSFYAAKLDPAARRAGIQWGAYVIPRTSGQTRYGMMQKVLSVIGHGGKGLKYFVFGPEYNFPGNCYSPRAPELLPKMAEVHGMIAAAEDVLWPGRKPQAQVAILQPRSSELWDSNGISDATNTHLNRRTVDYMAEIFDLYCGLQQQNIPAEFVAEDELNAKGLKGYKVLYVTEPNFPREAVPALAKWVEDGGVLASVSGALTRDRYNDPMNEFQSARGIVETAHERLPLPDAAKLEPIDAVDGANVYGVKTALEKHAGTVVVATFKDGAPAIVERASGKGKFIHYAFFPGISAYAGRQQAAVPFSQTALNWIARPTRAAGVTPPVVVDQLNVETPLLLSDDAAAITLLNWRGEDLSALKVSVRLDRKATSVESVTSGKMEFEQKDGTITFSLPLRGADVVTIK